MSSRMHRPETVTIPLSKDDWLIVKKRLNAGERRRVFTRMIKRQVPNEPSELDPFEAGRSLVLGYLLDWSFADADGTVVSLRGKSVEDIANMVDAIDIESFLEVRDAIEAHDEAMTKERAAEKNAQDGANKSSTTSPSAE